MLAAQNGGYLDGRYDNPDDLAAGKLTPVFDPQGFLAPVAQKAVPSVLTTTLEAAGGPVALGLGLLFHTSDAPTNNWSIGGQSFSYNPDDFSLSVNSTAGSIINNNTAGIFASPTVISGISNPSPYSDINYLEYLTYKANGGTLAINDYVSTGMPQPGQEPATVTQGDGGNWTLARYPTIQTVDGQTVGLGPISNRVLSYYQDAFNSGYAFAQSQLAAGNLNVPDGVSSQTILGQVADQQARDALKIALAPNGALSDLSDSVLVNRYLRDPSSNNYVIPDIRIPAENVIIDGTIGYKDNTTLQVQKFFNFSPPTATVVIVTPNQPQAVLRPK